MNQGKNGLIASDTQHRISGLRGLLKLIQDPGYMDVAWLLNKFMDDVVASFFVQRSRTLGWYFAKYREKEPHPHTCPETGACYEVVFEPYFGIVKVSAGDWWIGFEVRQWKNIDRPRRRYWTVEPTLVSFDGSLRSLKSAMAMLKLRIAP